MDFIFAGEDVNAVLDTARARSGGVEEQLAILAIAMVVASHGGRATKSRALALVDECFDMEIAIVPSRGELCPAK